MINEWEVKLVARYGDDKFPFYAIYEAETKAEAYKKACKEYRNAVIEDVTLYNATPLNVQDLYESLNGLTPAEIVDERNEDNEEDIPDWVVDKAKEYRVGGRRSYKDIVTAILDDPKIKRWFDAKYFGNEYDLRIELEDIIETQIEKNDTGEDDIEESKEKETLYICNECGKTFRSNENTCPTCKKVSEKVVQEAAVKDVKFKKEKEKKEDLDTEKKPKDTTASAEVKIEGQNDLSSDVKADEGGELKDKDTQNKKNESINPNDDTNKRVIVAKGIVDEGEAKRIAQEKRGEVVSDEEDKSKFMVVVKESAGVPFVGNKEEIKEAIDDDNYTVEADLSLHLEHAEDNYDINAPRKVSITYRMEFEHRSWGIKNIDVSVVKPIVISYELVKWGEDKDETTPVELTISPDQLEYEWEHQSGSGIVIDMLSVNVTMDGKTDGGVVSVSYGR